MVQPWSDRFRRILLFCIEIKYKKWYVINIYNFIQKKNSINHTTKQGNSIQGNSILENSIQENSIQETAYRKQHIKQSTAISIKTKTT